jgi:hypothetical protein
MPYLPRGSELAARLAKAYDSPLTDETNLARVGQYVASLVEPAFLKRRICRKLADAQPRSTAQ